MPPENTPQPSSPQTPPQPPAVSTLKTFRSYASDMAEAVRKQQGSVMKIAMAEQEKKKREVDNVRPTSKKNILFSLGALAVAALAVGAIYFGFFASKRPATIAPSTTVRDESFIAYDTSVAIDVTNKETLQSSVASALAAPHELGSITLFAPKVAVPPEEGMPLYIANLITLDFTAALRRSLTNDFAFGIHTWEGNEPFMIFTSDSFDTAFVGLIDAERTLYSDIAELFDLPATDADGSAFADKAFVDDVIMNHDIRAIKNSLGENIFFYAITNDGHIIFARSDATFVEIMNRIR